MSFLNKVLRVLQRELNIHFETKEEEESLDNKTKTLLLKDTFGALIKAHQTHTNDLAKILEARIKTMDVVNDLTPEQVELMWEYIYSDKTTTYATFKELVIDKLKFHDIADADWKNKSAVEMYRKYTSDEKLYGPDKKEKVEIGFILGSRKLNYSQQYMFNLMVEMFSRGILVNTPIRYSRNTTGCFAGYEGKLAFSVDRQFDTESNAKRMKGESTK